MNERFDDVTLTEEDLSWMAYLESKRRLASYRARRNGWYMEDSYFDADDEF